jgi:hypothetical protein
MKVLVMYTEYFAFKPGEKTIVETAEVKDGSSFSNCIVAFIQIEADDEEKELPGREKKLTNHLKWTLRKNNCQKIVLHSFSHLSDSKASIGFTQSLLNAAELRLQNSGYETTQTPFGYFLDLEIKAPGFSLARIWASL